MEALIFFKEANLAGEIARPAFSVVSSRSKTLKKVKMRLNRTNLPVQSRKFNLILVVSGIKPKHVFSHGIFQGSFHSNICGAF